MTNKEILEQAIQKAIDGGWFGCLDRSGSETWIVTGNMHFLLDGRPPREVIFSHDFAKALWGDVKWRDQSVEERYYPDEDQPQWDGGPEWFEFSGTLWQCHLQSMVIAEDPIAYLGANI